MNASDTASEHHCPSCGSDLIHTEDDRHECHSCGKVWPVNETETEPFEIYANESIESAVIRLANFKKQRDGDDLLMAHRAIAGAAERQAKQIEQDRADNG